MNKKHKIKDGTLCEFVCSGHELNGEHVTVLGPVILGAKIAKHYTFMSEDAGLMYYINTNISSDIGHGMFLIPCAFERNLKPIVKPVLHTALDKWLVKALSSKSKSGAL